MVGPTISHPNPKISFAVCSLLIFPHPLQNCIVMNGCTTMCLKTKHIWFVRLAWSVARVGRTYHNNIYRFSSASLVVRLRPISAEIVRFPPRSSDFRGGRPSEKSPEYASRVTTDLDMFVKFQKDAIGFLYFWRLSVSSSFLSLTTRLHLDRFSWNFIIAVFLNSVHQIQRFLYPGENKRQFIQR